MNFYATNRSLDDINHYYISLDHNYYRVRFLVKTINYVRYNVPTTYDKNEWYPYLKWVGNEIRKLGYSRLKNNTTRLLRQYLIIISEMKHGITLLKKHSKILDNIYYCNIASISKCFKNTKFNNFKYIFTNKVIDYKELPLLAICNNDDRVFRYVIDDPKFNESYLTKDFFCELFRKEPKYILKRLKYISSKINFDKSLVMKNLFTNNINLFKSVCKYYYDESFKFTYSFFSYNLGLGTILNNNNEHIDDNVQIIRNILLTDGEKQIFDIYMESKRPYININVLEQEGICEKGKEICFTEWFYSFVTPPLLYFNNNINESDMNILNHLYYI